MASTFPGAIDNFTDPLSGSALNSPSHSAQHADLNDAAEKIETYMGLVKVIPTGATNGTVSATGTVTIGNAVSSVTVNGAFSSLYNNYKVIVSGGAATSPGGPVVTLGATATGYYQAGVFVQIGVGTVTALNTSNGTGWSNMGRQSTNGINCVFDLFEPFNAKRTSFIQHAPTPETNGFYISQSGMVDNTTSYTAFTLAAGGGTFTGGSLTVYGYRI